VAVPVPAKVAVFPLKVIMELLLEVQVVEAVTSTLFNVAVKTACVPCVKVVPDGVELMTKACPLPPVTVPVADPATPPKLALMVTPVIAPIPFTVPLATVTHGVELCHVAELVTSLFPSL